MRNTVDTGRTVVCTIHQPSIDIFEVSCCDQPGSRRQDHLSHVSLARKQKVTLAPGTDSCLAPRLLQGSTHDAAHNVDVWSLLSLGLPQSRIVQQIFIQAKASISLTNFNPILSARPLLTAHDQNATIA